MNQSGPDAIELFAGIGGFRVVADALGWQTIWANDTCPLACRVYRDQFGEANLHEGDVRQFVVSIPPHDLLTAGFPCQPFSSAGKKKGVRDIRGTLFQVIVDVLATHRPCYFVLENVKRLLTMEAGTHFATILHALASLEYNVEWRLLNAVHFGLPQNRERVFLVGTRSSANLGQLSIHLATPEDLRDLNCGEREILGNRQHWDEITKHRSRFPTWGVASCGKFFATNLQIFEEACELVNLMSVLQSDVSAEFDFTEATLKWVQNNRPVNRLVNGVEILSNQEGGARMGYTIFGTAGVAPTLTSTTSRHYEWYKIGEQYRRLTNIEYARIQGFGDDHCRVASVYDQYALYGNAVPPPMARWVMARLQSDGLGCNDIPRPKRNLTLFDYAN